MKVPPLSRPSLAGLTAGQTLAGKYLLVREVGSGGMCVVFEAEHVNLRLPIAVKVLKPELAQDPGCVARFEREARAAAQLRSQNVARVFDVDWYEGQPYITMELLVGHDLGSELQRVGRLPLSLAVDYVRQAASGIAEAHALGIVHRDLKPENLFLVDLGGFTDRRLLKILDFGIAKDVAESARKLTAPDAVFGTVDYMSPEQIRSASSVDHRTDLWSLGVILYELITGRTPYTGDARSVIAQIVSDPVRPPSTFVRDLPPSLVAVVMRALDKDPARRFQSADELRQALAPYADLEAITSVVARLPPESMPRRASNRPAPFDGEPTRESRTNASWEARAAGRTRARSWAIAGGAALLVASGAGALVATNPGALASFGARSPGADAPPPAAAEPVAATAPTAAEPVVATATATTAAIVAAPASAPAASVDANGGDVELDDGSADAPPASSADRPSKPAVKRRRAPRSARPSPAPTALPKRL